MNADEYDEYDEYLQDLQGSVPLEPGLFGAPKHLYESSLIPELRFRIIGLLETLYSNLRSEINYIEDLEHDPCLRKFASHKFQKR